MVSTLSILFMVVTLALSILLPCAILLVLMKGRKGVFGVWVAGALGFIVPQLFIRIPVLQLLGTQPAYQQFGKNHPYLFVFLVALSAALFETIGRLVVLKVGLAKRLSYMTGFTAGAGHGGIEAIYLVGLTYINNLVISLFINANRLSAIIPKDPALAENVRQQLVSTSPHLFLVAGVERLLTLPFHIALSIMLTLFIIKKHTAVGFLLVAVLHFIVDFAVGILQVQGVALFVIEGLVFVVGLASLAVIIKLRPSFNEKQMIPADAGEQAVKEGY
jgi:uncharacterized membrane protein YhfC